MTCEDKLDDKLKKSRESGFDILDEMTMLNNELVNTQRKLVKQNAEVNRLNKQLKSANADLKQFTYVASHDLKEPLRTVRNFMDLLKRKYGSKLDEKANSYINFALDGSIRMQKMMDGLLELLRAGNNNVVKKLTNINHVLKDVTENLLVLFNETGAELKVKTTLPDVVVNRPEITRLFQNLITNAIKFRKNDAKPAIVLDVRDMQNEWQFSMQDNGIGIEKEKQREIFEIFKRLHSHEAYEGTGLGLAVCKKITEQHGGTIWVESEEGKGSTFYFTLSKYTSQGVHQ